MKTINRLLTAGTVSMAGHLALLWSMGVTVPECSPEYFPVQEPELVMVETPDVEETLEEVVEEVPEDIDFGERQRAKAAPAQPRAQRTSYAAPIKRIDTTTAVNAILDGEMSPIEAYTRSHGSDERNQDSYLAFYKEYERIHISRYFASNNVREMTTQKLIDDTPPRHKMECTFGQNTFKPFKIIFSNDGTFEMGKVRLAKGFYERFRYSEGIQFIRAFASLPRRFVPPSAAGLEDNLVVESGWVSTECKYAPIEVEE